MENERAIRTATNRIKAFQSAREKEIDEALAALMQHGQGRRFVNWLLTLGRLGANPYSGQALSTMFNCGELNVAQRVLDRLLRVAPDQYIKMLKELENERHTDNAELARANSPSGDEYADADNGG